MPVICCNSSCRKVLAMTSPSGVIEIRRGGQTSTIFGATRITFHCQQCQAVTEWTAAVPHSPMPLPSVV